jgi:hypothetical protein
MTRREAAAVLADLLRPYNVAVAADPVSAATPPCVILNPTGPYRTRDTACWATTLDAIVVGGRMDDVGCYDQLDDVADTFCRVVTASLGIVNRGATSGPEIRAIGQVDYLAVTFTCTIYDLGPGLTAT